MCVDLTWENDNGLPKRVVVKAPKMDHVNKIVEDIGAPPMDEGFVSSAHKTECIAYNILSQGSPVPIPKVYGCWPITETHPGLIIMEDLTDKAGLIDNLAKGLNLNQWKSIVASLADLHAWSLTTKVPWREQVCGIESLTVIFKGFQEMSEFGLRAAKEKYPEYFADLDEKACLKHLHPDAMIAKHVSFRKLMDDVMQHGDTWINNIMFGKKPDGTVDDTVKAFVDWQICVQGNGLNDITRLETWCVNHEMRRKHYKEMLHFYYDRLKAKAGEKINLSFENLEKIYEDTFVLNGFMFVSMIDGMIHSVARCAEDETGWRKKEMLERAKAVYEDAVKFCGSSF
jgi:hypothetical protein